MKQTLLLKAKDIKPNDYICNLFGTVKEIEDKGSHLAIKYESNGYISQIQPTYEYEFAVIREVW
jgi:hypothetical protein